MPIFDMIGCQGTPAGPQPFSHERALNAAEGSGSGQPA